MAFHVTLWIMLELFFRAQSSSLQNADFVSPEPKVPDIPANSPTTPSADADFERLCQCACDALALPWEHSIAEAKHARTQINSALSQIQRTHSHPESELNQLLVALGTHQITLPEFSTLTTSYKILSRQVSSAKATIEGVIENAQTAKRVSDSEALEVCESLDISREAFAQLLNSKKTAVQQGFMNWEDLTLSALFVVSEYIHFTEFRWDFMSTRFFLPFTRMLEEGETLEADVGRFEALVYNLAECDLAVLIELQEYVNEILTLMDGRHKVFCEYGHVKATDDLHAILLIRKFALENIRRVLYPDETTEVADDWSAGLSSQSRNEQSLITSLRSGRLIPDPDIVRLKYKTLLTHVTLYEEFMKRRPDYPDKIQLESRVQNTLAAADGLKHNAPEILPLQLIETAIDDVKEKGIVRTMLDNRSSSLPKTLTSIKTCFTRMRLLSLYAAALPENHRSRFFNAMKVAKESYNLAVVYENVEKTRTAT